MPRVAQTKRESKKKTAAPRSNIIQFPIIPKPLERVFPDIPDGTIINLHELLVSEGDYIVKVSDRNRIDVVDAEMNVRWRIVPVQGENLSRYTQKNGDPLSDLGGLRNAHN